MLARSCPRASHGENWWWPPTPEKPPPSYNLALRSPEMDPTLFHLPLSFAETDHVDESRAPWHVNNIACMWFKSKNHHLWIPPQMNKFIPNIGLQTITFYDKWYDTNRDWRTQLSWYKFYVGVTSYTCPYSGRANWNKYGTTKNNYFSSFTKKYGKTILQTVLIYTLWKIDIRVMLNRHDWYDQSKGTLHTLRQYEWFCFVCFYTNWITSTHDKLLNADLCLIKQNEFREMRI
jgi:hypothetical protein